MLSLSRALFRSAEKIVERQSSLYTAAALATSRSASTSQLTAKTLCLEGLQAQQSAYNFASHTRNFSSQAVYAQLNGAVVRAKGLAARAVVAGSSNPIALCTSRGLSTAAVDGATAVKSLVAGGEAAERQVMWWLAGCTGWVFSMVVLGGVTRLTRSGLSMTDWKFQGVMPPSTPEEWEVEFGKYKKSPEYIRVNRGMSLEDFKFIYWLEYGHRMWGRALGFVFAIPCAYFAARGYITRPLALRLGVLFTAGGCQGLVGWWMVKSGLEMPKNEYEIPRVSPYRLAAHLTSAFAIYTGLLWTTLSIRDTLPAALSPTASPQMLAGAKAVRSLVLPLSVLIGVTAISGAFVAGLDAGHAYNTFPLMGDSLIPEEYWGNSVYPFESILKNTFENTAAVQFHHRVLAVTTLCSVTSVWAMTRGMAMPPGTQTIMNCMLAMTYTQVALGITTLLTYVPVSLGSAHQAGALTLMSFAVAALHSLRGAGLGNPAALPIATAAAAAAGLGGGARIYESVMNS